MIFIVGRGSGSGSIIPPLFSTIAVAAMVVVIIIRMTMMILIVMVVGRKAVMSVSVIEALLSLLRTGIEGRL